MPPSAPPASALGKREPSPAPGRGEAAAAAVPAPARLPGRAGVGWEAGLRGVCRAEGMGAAAGARAGPGGCCRSGAVGRPGPEAGVAARQGAPAGRSEGAAVRPGLLTAFVTVRPGWLVLDTPPFAPAPRRPQPSCISLALHVAAVLCKPELERKNTKSESFARSPSPFPGSD